MVIISYIIKHIITNKNKILHKLFYALFAPYNKKKWKKYRICFRIHTEFYIYHLRKYRMNLRFTFYESLQAQCSKQEYKFVYKILYPIYSQSKKNDQKTDYRIITVSDRFHPYNSQPDNLAWPTPSIRNRCQSIPHGVASSSIRNWQSNGCRLCRCSALTDPYIHEYLRRQVHNKYTYTIMKRERKQQITAKFKQD